MNQVTLEQFEDKTNLLPDLVAQSVLGRAGYYYEEHPEFVKYATDKTLILYNHNERWRKMMHKSDNGSRDYLWMFIEHWLKAWMLGGKVRERMLEDVNKHLTKE